MKTTVQSKKNSNMQEMGETREPMARDCWTQAQELAEKYSESLKHDFWVLYAAKPHTVIPNAIVAGWDVVAKKPPAPIVGMLVFKWDHKERKLEVDPVLSLPYDIHIEEEELSKNSKDSFESLETAARKSGSVFLA